MGAILPRLKIILLSGLVATLCASQANACPPGWTEQGSAPTDTCTGVINPNNPATKQTVTIRNDNSLNYKTCTSGKSQPPTIASDGTVSCPGSAVTAATSATSTANLDQAQTDCDSAADDAK